MTATIVALTTPTGRSSIGVIRLSGGDSLRIARRLIGDNEFSPAPRVATLRSIVDQETDETIDEAIFTFFKAPHSFTGEDVVEISCHGSPVVLRRVIDLCLAIGARMAEAGEFSLRALANGRMNLAEAEALRDLIDAQTVAAARQSVRQLKGEFSHELQPIKDQLLDVIVLLESALEFVEDDLPDLQAESVMKKLRSIADSIEKIASTFKAGKLIREGLKVAIVGRPNVGKSSLFNALLGTDRAIVTEIAGTTRDQLHEKLTIGEIPISLIDTAGLRETVDTVESIGVERARRAMVDADVVIAMIDVSEPLTPEDAEVLKSAEVLTHCIALNKIDKLGESQGQAAAIFHRNLSESKFQISNLKSRIVPLSAITGEGLGLLHKAIVEPFAADDISTSGFLVSDARHHDLLVRAHAEIEHSLELLDKKSSEEITLVGLHNALRFLGQITGETTAEDMLTRIFSAFCIGK
ncbi:MAG: tRNA uridine-5-carboxymethylaminomethyl(34) synthesis GTPase MnmE [Pyrinomonadaceae bacterium]